MAKQKYVPRSGSKSELVARYLDKSTDEIMTAANKAGLKIDKKHIWVTKSELRKKGITKPLRAAPSSGASSSVPRRARPRATPPSPPTSDTAAAVERLADAFKTPKLALLRRVIFDVGFDAAKIVFDEFARMHEQARAYERNNGSRDT